MGLLFVVIDRREAYHPHCAATPERNKGFIVVRLIRCTNCCLWKVPNGNVWNKVKMEAVQMENTFIYKRNENYINR